MTNEPQHQRAREIVEEVYAMDRPPGLLFNEWVQRLTTEHQRGVDEERKRIREAMPRSKLVAVSDVIRVIDGEG